jgi:hypothetical protein
MSTQRRRVCAVRVVKADEWRDGTEALHDYCWGKLRTRWRREVRFGGWQLLEEPRETETVDEEHNEVRLDIRALCSRELPPRAPGEWAPH